MEQVVVIRLGNNGLVRESLLLKNQDDHSHKNPSLAIIFSFVSF